MLLMSESFAEKMRRARQVAGEVRGAVQAEKRAMMRDADDIIADGEAVHARRAEISVQRAQIKAAHQASIHMDHAELHDAQRELAEMQAELAQWGNGGDPLGAGEHSEDGSETTGEEPGKLGPNSWSKPST
jgi:hypothetical protein